MKNVFKLYLLLFLSAFAFLGCSTDRSLVEFETLNTNPTQPELDSDLLSKTAPKPKLPPVWRGRKLFSSPWAYIYANNKKSAEYVYDELKKISSAEEKQNSYGLVIVTGEEDEFKGFEYKKLKILYENYLKNNQLHEKEKEFFQNDLKDLKKIEKFHSKIDSKADEKKNENELLKFRQSINNIISLATFFIQPEIMEKYMDSQIDESIYWCAFISVDDTIDDNLDEVVAAILDDYNVSAIGRGLIWGIISPGFFFKKRDIIKETQRTFAEGYEKNALINKTNIEFSDRALNN